MNSSVDMNPVESWLQTYSSARLDKERTLKRFCKYLDKTPKQLLKLRETDENRGLEKLSLKWLNHLIENEGLQTSTATSMLGTIRSFFKYHDLDLKFKRNEVPKPRPKAYKFALKIEHLRAMWPYLSVWMRAFVIIGLENGLRVSDVQGLKKADIQNILDEPLPSMELSSKKTGAIAHIHLSKEAVTTIKAYLKTIAEDQTKLFVKDSDTINSAFQKAFRTAHQNIDYTPTFHDLRRLFLSTGSNLGISPWNLKLMCGKKIPDDVFVYLRGVDLKADFEKIKKVLCLKPTQTNDKTESLKQAIVQLESENRIFRTRLEVIEEQFEKLKDEIKEAWLSTQHKKK